jgi:Uma2 family endonuclease
MATLITPSPGENFNPTPRPLTAADLAVMPTDLPSGPVRYELDDGRLVTMPPNPGDEHGAVESNVVTQFKTQGEFRGLGKARCGEVFVILRRNPDRVVGADALFIANKSLPIRLSPEGYLVTIPDLIVEVRSKNDTLPEIQRKVGEYLAAGVQVVWSADPSTQTVTAYRANQPPQVFGPNDTLTVEDVIPGFSMPISDVFAL